MQMPCVFIRDIAERAARTVSLTAWQAPLGFLVQRQGVRQIGAKSFSH